MTQQCDTQELAQMQVLAEEEGRQCVVGAVVIDERGRAFAQKRSPNRRLFPECWDLIGGHVEDGETLVEALQREIREETGWELKRIVGLVYAFDWETGTGDRRREFDFAVQVEGNLAHPQLEWSKNSEFRWLEMHELELLKENRQPEESILFEVVRKGIENFRP